MERGRTSTESALVLSRSMLLPGQPAGRGAGLAPHVPRERRATLSPRVLAAAVLSASTIGAAGSRGRRSPGPARDRVVDGEEPAFGSLVALPVLHGDRGGVMPITQRGRSSLRLVRRVVEGIGVQLEEEAFSAGDLRARRVPRNIAAVQLELQRAQVDAAAFVGYLGADVERRPPVQVFALLGIQTSDGWRQGVRGIVPECRERPVVAENIQD